MKYTFSHEFLVRKEKTRNIFFKKFAIFGMEIFSTKASCSRTLSVCLKHRKARCALLICTSFNTITTTLQPCFQLMALLRQELHKASISNRTGDHLHEQAVGQQWQAVSWPKGEPQECCEPVCNHVKRVGVPNRVTTFAPMIFIPYILHMLNILCLIIYFLAVSVTYTFCNLYHL